MKCLYCGTETDRPKFCSNRHKDRYHNENNPRGRFAHLAHREDGPVEETDPTEWDHAEGALGT